MLARMERTKLGRLDADAVRVQLETRILRRLVDRFGDEIRATMPSSEDIRRVWLAGAVGFSPELAPRGLGVVGEARRVLGIDAAAPSRSRPSPRPTHTAP